jgi:hypothetical protein
MKVSALKCPQCGGSQDVADDRHHVECRYCRTLLRVERSATGELEGLLVEAEEENAELLAENRRLAITNAIHRLDAGWAEKQKTLMVAGRDGPQVPSELLGWAVTLLGGFTLVPGITFVLDSARWEGLAVVAIGFVVGAVGVSNVAAAQRYKIAKRWYERRRIQLTEDLAEAESIMAEPRGRARRSYEDTSARRRRLDDLSYPAADA